MDRDVDADAPNGVEEDDVDVLYLEPGAWPRNGKAKWKATGRTMMAGVNPVGGEIIAWLAKKVRIYEYDTLFLAHLPVAIDRSQQTSEPLRPQA